MTVISAALVKELRDQTGAPMMDVKRALVDTNGDMEAAQRLLRERGMASAEKRAGRATTEGKVGYRIGDDAKRGTMVAVGCETEPVSNNDEFLAFAKKVLEAVEADGPDAAARLDEERLALVRQARREHRRRRGRSLRGDRRCADRGLRSPAREQARRARAGSRRLGRHRPQDRDAHRGLVPAVGRPGRRAGGRRQVGARDLRELGRGACRSPSRLARRSSKECSTSASLRIAS